MRSGVGLSLSGGVCEGVEHARGGGSAYSTCERKSALISGSAASIFLIWMSKYCTWVATLFKVAPRDSPVGGKPPKHNVGVEQLAVFFPDSWDFAKRTQNQYSCFRRQTMCAWMSRKDLARRRELT